MRAGTRGPPSAWPFESNNTAHLATEEWTYQSSSAGYLSLRLGGVRAMSVYKNPTRRSQSAVLLARLQTACVADNHGWFCSFLLSNGQGVAPKAQRSEIKATWNSRSYLLSQNRYVFYQHASV
jgi:hypothetical protein